MRNNKNEFEITVMEYLSQFYNYLYPLGRNSYDAYRILKNCVCDNTLFTDVPNEIGKVTEFVFATENHSMRIECKYQLNKGDIQFNSILGNIWNLRNHLIENELIFVINGDGFKLSDIEKLRNELKPNESIFLFNEFKEYFRKMIGVN